MIYFVSFLTALIASVTLVASVWRTPIRLTAPEIPRSSDGCTQDLVLAGGAEAVRAGAGDVHSFFFPETVSLHGDSRTPIRAARSPTGIAISRALKPAGRSVRCRHP